MSDKILEVKNLHVSFDTYAGEVKAIRGVDFHINKGESLAIVGESGSGKSVTVQTVMRLIPMPPGRIKEGEILFKGNNLVEYSEKEMRKIRGGEIGMIFQDPMTSLNPTMTVGKQIAEGIIAHRGVSKKEAMEMALKMLEAVNIPNAKERLHAYPHQFSGGMRQRVVIAIALACDPDLLIADEPTTALDVTVQAQILDLMKELKDKRNTSIILITHDLGVVADISERVVVMYGGEIMEEASVNDIFKSPKHPYTWGLIKSIPRLDIDSKSEKLASIDGTPPDLFSPPVGCPFAPRCEFAMGICKKSKPGMINAGDKHKVACWLLDDRSEEVINPITGKSTKEK